MPITSIRFFTCTPRPKPKTGDRRTTKAHGLQIRIPAMINDSDWRGNGCM